MALQGVQGCVFCDIIWNKKELHLKSSDKVVVIKDKSPHAPHHYLALSKCHINKPSDLTAADVELVEEMEQTARDLLREKLKEKGDADTIEDLLRLGFHSGPLLSVAHVHMHLLYPLNEMSFLNKSVVFRPSRFFHTTENVLKDLKSKRGDKVEEPALNPDIVDASMK